MGASVSQTVVLRIENQTSSNILKISVSDIDWAFVNGKTTFKNTENLIVRVNSYEDQQIAVWRQIGNGAFKMRVKYLDGTKDEIKMNLKWACYQAPAHFQNIKGHHAVTYERAENGDNFVLKLVFKN